MSKKKQKKEYEPVHYRLDDDGVIRVHADEGGSLVALVLPWCGTVADLRESPPYLPMSPCPHCGVEKDKGHIALLHVDPCLGDKRKKTG